MTNPNRVVANMAKRPFEPVMPFDEEFGFDQWKEGSARSAVAKLKEAGWDAKMTVVRRKGSKWDPRGHLKVTRQFNVWKREKVSK